MFKKLTTVNGDRIAVNMDHVIHARAMHAGTELVFRGKAGELIGVGNGAENEVLPRAIRVTESIDEIFP